MNQKPDVLLEVELRGKGNRRLVWLFDAKYRIRVFDRKDSPDLDESVDYVPDDALNQMHRYRDALIRTVGVGGDDLHCKSRPVVGAFALYPGYFNQAVDKNPYEVPISEVGIGAFALLPSGNIDSGSLWLTEFLRSEIGELDISITATSTDFRSDEFYIRESARIPYEGMRQVLYPDLIMTAVVADAEGRTDDYLKRFADGSASWYHMPEDRFKEKNFGYHVAHEIRYIALAINSHSSSELKTIERLWPVNSVELLQRDKISQEQAGKKSTSCDTYFLFKLGKPLMLKDPIIHVPNSPFNDSLKLTTLVHLEQALEFSDLREVYPSMLTSSP